MLGAVQTGCFVMAAIGAFYLLTNRHEVYGRIFVKGGVLVGMVAALLQLFPTGDTQGKLISQHQPITLAAMEGRFESGPNAPLTFIGQPNVRERRIDNAIHAPAVLSILAYGTPQGYLPLRQQLSLKLSALEIPAEPEQIVTTAGVTHAIDLVARHFLRPGDAVFVDDPAWFVMFARFAMLGARVIGVPRRADGPDLEALRGLLVAHRPKLFVLSSVLHNPTGTSMTAANAYAVLQLAEEHGVTLVEDDIYGDLSPDATPNPPARVTALRLAALDRRRRVIYVSGFSKTLAANLRVGYLVAPPELALALADQKLLGALTTPEFGERVIARVLIERRYARHCAGLRANLDAARTTVLARLRKLGARVFAEDAQGMFLWADLGTDTNALATRLFDAGYLAAPGSLFCPSQLPSTWMRFNVASSQNPEMWRALQKALA